jgi:3alpha(or 20beta)-hydroxysteroid dehydrogenase
MSGRVEGKVALITGGARGQGASHGEVLAREGAQVVLADVLDEEGAIFADRLAGEGLPIRYTHLDVSSPEDWDAALRFTEAEFGTANVLVNNAGIGSGSDGPSGIVDCSLDDWERVIAVNQTGVFLGMQSVIPGMKASGGGSIINIASDWAHCGGAANGWSAYVSSKHAVIGLTRNAALSLASDKIRVNSVSPASVATPMVGEPDAVHRELIARTPMKRMATPEEISQIVLYLASDEASYATGSDFLVDGGLHTA